MEITFVHTCPTCRRRQQLVIDRLGQQIRCDCCGRLAVAQDPEIESAALLDSMKDHAELATFGRPDPDRWQPPR